MRLRSVRGWFLRRIVAGLRPLGPWLLLVLSLACTRSAQARERLAVIVLAGSEPELAENLSEVALSKLAELERFELVGTRELELGLKQLPTWSDRGLAACVVAPECLAELGVRSGATRAVVAKVARHDAGFDLDLALLDTGSGTPRVERKERVAGTVTELIRALQARTLELFTAAAGEPSPPRDAVPQREPAASGAPQQPKPAAVRARATSAARRYDATAPRADARSPAEEHTKPQTYVGLGAAGLAVLAFSAALTTGVIASAPPGGGTRAERQADLERRRDFASAANISALVGGALAATAVIAFIWP